MSSCNPLPTDTPGIYRCSVCGKQNPRPIPKPFHAACGKADPPEPRDPEDVGYILAVLCPDCEQCHHGRCQLMIRCNGTATRVEDMVENPRQQCPAWRW